MRNFSSRMKTSGWSALMTTMSRDEIRDGVIAEPSKANGHCIAPSNTLSVKVVKKGTSKVASKMTNTFNLRQEVASHQASKVNEKAKARDAFAKLFS